MKGLDPKDKLYSLKETAELLRVSERSVFRYIHGGKLRATKIGYWRISESDLKDFLSKNANVLETMNKKSMFIPIKTRVLKKAK